MDRLLFVLFAMLGMDHNQFSQNGWMNTPTKTTCSAGYRGDPQHLKVRGSSTVFALKREELLGHGQSQNCEVLYQHEELGQH